MWVDELLTKFGHALNDLIKSVDNSLYEVDRLLCEESDGDWDSDIGECPGGSLSFA